MKRTLLDLVKDNNKYVFDYHLQKGYHLFIECLTENLESCDCIYKDFAIKNVEFIMVELVNEETNEAINLKDFYPITLGSNLNCLSWFAHGMIEGMKYKEKQK